MDIFKKIDEKKALIDKARPFEGELLKQLKSYYKIGLTYSSNALEGNTLTESETKIIIEDGLTVGGKPLKDTFEALGHAKAYDFMFSLLNKEEITEDDIKTFHKLFFSDINPKEAGQYRSIPVIISGSAYPVCKVDKIPQKMTELLEWANNGRTKLHPVEFAAQLHKRFVFIHPFIDGNGRVARLLMNTALIQSGYMLAIIPPTLRLEYGLALESAHENDKKFVELIAKQVLETEREVIRLLHLDN